MPESTKIYQNLPKFARIYRNISHFAKTYQNLKRFIYKAQLHYLFQNDRRKNDNRRRNEGDHRRVGDNRRRDEGDRHKGDVAAAAGTVLS